MDPPSGRGFHPTASVGWLPLVALKVSFRAGDPPERRILIKATPHKERLRPEARTCLHLFRHTSQKSSRIHKVFAAAFVLSDEKSDGAIPHFSLCGVALNFHFRNRLLYFYCMKPFSRAGRSCRQTPFGRLKSSPRALQRGPLPKGCRWCSRWRLLRRI